MESPRPSMSLQDQLEFWKDQAKHYEQKANDIQQELDEYTENSAQLEKELEASLVQVEKQNRDLDCQNQRLKNEIEMLKNKLERSQHETTALENELQALKLDKDRQAIYIRELEQKNDDLERGQRVISESVSCIESMLNQAYERNAVLESEVDEIENLRVKLQRANDEARDLKQELKVVERIPVLKKEECSENDNIIANGHVSIAQKQVEMETQTSITTPLKREINGNGLTPSSRVTAINIVGDLLRKVGLERFLCRECGNVKCACAAPATAPIAAEPDENAFGDDAIEFRNPRLSLTPDTQIPHKPPLATNRASDTTFVRSNSGDNCSKPPVISQRASESPFTRSSTGDNGRLRRSFAVRSREGLENLLSFARKGPDHKVKNSVRQ